VFLIDKVSSGLPWFIPLEGTSAPFDEPIRLKHVLKDTHTEYKNKGKIPGKLTIPAKQYGVVEIRVYENHVKGIERRVIAFTAEHPHTRKHGGVHGTD
jgi:hypothetical protein